jgi:hypothetical protein
MGGETVVLICSKCPIKRPYTGKCPGNMVCEKWDLLVQQVERMTPKELSELDTYFVTRMHEICRRTGELSGMCVDFTVDGRMGMYRVFSSDTGVSGLISLRDLHEFSVEATAQRLVPYLGGEKK